MPIRGIAGGLCAALLCAIATLARADDWPQWRGPSRDGVWRETGVVENFDSPALEPRWRVEIAGGYSGPTVADGRVYVTDRLVEPKQIERIHCFDAKTGKKIWTHEYDCEYRGVQYDAGPRACVTLDGGRAYAIGSMGHLFCLDAVKGSVIWSKDCNEEFKIKMPIWGISVSPLIDGDRLILQIGGANGACVVALNKRTGKEIWRALDDGVSYSTPIIIDQAGKPALVVWTADSVAALAPATGKVLWRVPFDRGRVSMNIASPVHDDQRIFVSAFFDGSLMLKLDEKKSKATKLWRRKGKDEKNTDSLHCVMSTPILDGGHLYGVDSYGELRCLNAKTGDRIWESLDAVPKERWSNIHMVRNGKNVWMFNERGDLIIARLSPKGYEEISRTHLIDPTTGQLGQRGGVCWSHPAFADRCVFIRNDRELLCAGLSAQRATGSDK